MEFLEVSPAQFDKIHGGNFDNLKIQRDSVVRPYKKRKKRTAYITTKQPVTIVPPNPYSTDIVNNWRLNSDIVISDLNQNINKPFVRGLNQYIRHLEPNHANWFKKRLAFVKGEAKAVEKVGGKIFKAIEGATIFLPLQPLRGMMLKSLKESGHPKGNGDPIAEIATDFYKFVVKKHPLSKIPNPSAKQSFDGFESYFHEIGSDFSSFEKENNADDTIGFIIEAIMAFIKMLKSAKAHGLNVGKIGNFVINGTDEAMLKAKNAAINEIVDESILGFVKSKKGLTTIGISIAIVIIAIVIIVRG